MGLIDRVTTDRDTRLLEEAALNLVQTREEQELRIQSIVLVTDTLKIKATSLEETLEEVDEAIGLPKYYLFGGVVIAVQMFSSPVREIKPDPVNKPELVTAQYYVSVMGADKRSKTSVDSFRVGTVKYLDYESFYKALTCAPSYITFETDVVLERLRLK